MRSSAYEKALKARVDHEPSQSSEKNPDARLGLKVSLRQKTNASYRGKITGESFIRRPLQKKTHVGGKT